MTNKEYGQSEWIKEPVDRLADKIRNILVEVGQHDIEKFHFRDTIKYTPSEVQNILSEHWSDFLENSSDVQSCTVRQFPKTEKFLAEVENVFAKIVRNTDDYPEGFSEEDQFVFENPMLILAGTIYSDSKDWAVELAEHILILDRMHK